MDDLRGTPMSVGTLEEIIDDTHAIVSTSVGSEHYVSILSFVDKDQVTVLFHSSLYHLCSLRYFFFCLFSAGARLLCSSKPQGSRHSWCSQ